MNQFKKKINDFFYRFLQRRGWDNMTIQNRMFLVIATIGTFAAFVSMFETLAVMQSRLLGIILFMLFIMVFVAFWLSIYRKKIEGAAIFMGLFLSIVVFPSLFWFQGGIESGAPLWFLVEFFYAFLLFSGWKLVAYLTLSSVIDIALYQIAVYWPDLIEPAASYQVAYNDSLYSVLVVGFGLGLMVRIQNRLYEKERAVSEQRQAELEAASRSKNALFAGMSHEIRTPINTIMGLNELIQRSNPSPEVADYANDIENASSMLLSLVNDILDFSRLEIRQMDIVPAEYGSKNLFLNLYDMIRIQAEKKGLELHMDVDAQVPGILYGDEKRVKQVLLNLLNNAVKYTENGSISLAATGEKTIEGDYLLQISVADTGIGIKKEEVASIYETFHRVDQQRNSTVEGSGLGLSIVKQLVDLMGGTINVDSIYTKGSTFTVTLPQRIVDHTPVGNIHFGVADEKKKYSYRQKFEAPDARVLIVDDNRMNALVTSRLLASTRMQVYSVTSGKECLDLTRQKYFHVILMDYMMPEMDGQQTLEALRKQENGLCRDTPVIALTATTRDETESRVIDAQFDAFLEKPIRSEILEEEIVNLLPREIVEYRQEKLDYDAVDDNPAISSRRKKKLRITTDCVADLPREMLEKYDIHVQRLYIRTEHGRFMDTEEIDSDNLSSYLKSSGEKMTADSCSVEEYENFFAENLAEAVEVIHISMASASGVTYSRACEAAQGFDHVHVFDAGHVSCGEGLLALEAARLAGLGKTAEEILNALDERAEFVDNGFMMNNANTFYEHGFTGKLAVWWGRLLHRHPTLRMRRRRIELAGFMSGEGEHLWRRYVSVRLRKERKIDSRIILVCFASCSAAQKEIILDEIAKHISFDTVVICKSSFTNACTCGEGTFGFAFFEKE